MNQIIPEQAVLLAEIAQERRRQDEKWGEQNHDPTLWMAVLMEEVGEAASEALAIHLQAGLPSYLEANLRKEMVQVAAVAVAIIECLDRKKWKEPS